MRFLQTLMLLAFLAACSESDESKTVGGLISLRDDGNCSLIIYNSENMPKTRVEATECTFKTLGEKSAFVKDCGRVEFTPVNQIPSNELLVCDNCDLLAVQQASCGLKMAGPPLFWKAK